MMKLARLSAFVAFFLGVTYVMTLPAVTERMPEPLKTGLEKMRLDLDKIAAGKGGEGKLTPGQASGGDGGGIPLLRSNGVPN